MYFVQLNNKESDSLSARASQFATRASQFAGPAFVKRYRKRKGGYKRSPEPKSANNCLPNRRQLVEEMRIWDAQEALDAMFDGPLEAPVSLVSLPDNTLPSRNSCWEDNANWRRYKQLYAS